MSSTNQFRPTWVSAPGETIADILSERNMSLTDFARQTEQTTQQAKDLLDGRASVTLSIARSLERFLGGSVEFWMARDFQYREDISRLNSDSKEWLSELPLTDMIRYGWLKPVPHPSEETSACLRFFNVSTISGWREKYSKLQQCVAFRTSPTFESRPASVAAWLRQGEIESERVHCAAWDPARFRKALLDIRSLTRQKDPRHFLPRLRELCAASGVAVVVVRGPNGCRASGATFFTSRTKAVLMLSVRYLADDQFWFSFFHEAGHLLLHGEDGFFVEGIDNSTTKQEQEANEFAQNSLIPGEFQAAFWALTADARKVIRFAQRIGIAPGIVVGQLQHHRRIKPNYLNGLKRRYTWQE